jgi:hypothetical protein
MVELVEVERGIWRVKRTGSPVARSALPCPMLISDEMPPTEHVDGRHYTSKAAFRAITRAHGLTEVGNERFKPKQRSTDDRSAKTARKRAVKTAAEKYRAGHRPG